MAGPDSKDQIAVQTSSTGPLATVSESQPRSQSQSESHSHSHSKDAAVIVTESSPAGREQEQEQEREQEQEHRPRDGEEAIGDQLDTQKKGFLAYFTTKEFYITLLLGQVLAITNTATSTLSSLLEQNNVKIPAFQTFFNYILLTLIFTPYTIYRYGFKKWMRLIYRDCWKYIILAFCDVEGNYFIVLSFQYTTMLSTSLINFWAIAMVVIVSFIFLRVRYHITQIAGILICIGGMGILIASDHITGSNGGNAPDQVKGDLFALLGATFYGLTNTVEEYFVSKRPVYEVLGQMSLYALIINGTQAAIFDRASIRDSAPQWDGTTGGYLAGYTLCLTLFYCLAPLLFRLASAAFFNISMLTMNFWGVVIGVEVFAYRIHWMYPIAFVCIILGQLVYYLGRRVLGEARKPWLGSDQERGVAGVFTARRKIEGRAGAAAPGSLDTVV